MSNSLGRLFALRRCVRNASPTVQGSSIDDESRGRVAFECADLTLAIVEHAVGPIPIGGPPLKAVIGGLRKLMEAGDKFVQNKQDLHNLEKRLTWLNDHIASVPAPNNEAIRKLREKLADQLNESLAKLDRVRKMSATRKFFQYSSITKIIEGCSKDIGSYFLEYSILSAMHLESSLQQMKENTETALQQMKEDTGASVQKLIETIYTLSTQPIITFTGVILVDATGRRREVPMDFAESYAIFTDAMRLFFKSDTLEARIQRRYMEEGNYDLCIDKTEEVAVIKGQPHWSQVQPGTTIIMRAVVTTQTFTDQYTCPRCGAMNIATKNGPFVDCQGCESRLQVSNGTIPWEKIHRETEENEILVLRNFCVKATFKRRPQFSRVDRKTTHISPEFIQNGSRFSISHPEQD